jgi:flagellar biosynthesis/type III secretory pathway M-ring protein FliF/YscJ
MLPWEEETKNMPKIPIKKVVITITVLAIGALILFSLWLNFQTYWEKYKDGIRKDTIGQIILQVQQTGQVMFTSPQGNIILIPRPQ